MDYQSILSWKIVLKLSEISPDYTKNHKLFNIRTGKSFIKGIGGIDVDECGFFPTVLEPTNIFHNALNRIKKDTGFKGRRFPYLNESGQKFNVSFRLYSNRTVIASIALLSDINSPKNGIPDLQKLSSHKEIYDIVCNALGLISSGDAKKFTVQTSPKIYPITQTIIGSESSWISDELAVEVVTRHPQPNENIVSDVVSKNSEHQLDNSNILMDRQGIFYRIPEHSFNSPSVKKKFLGTSNLFEYAVAISYLLRNGTYFRLNNVEKNFINEIITNPKLVFLESTTSLETWDLLVKEFRLDILLDSVSKKKAYNKEKEASRFIEMFSYLKSISPESKTGVLILAVLGGVWGVFSQTPYYDRLIDPIVSLKSIEIIVPEDAKLASPIDGKILIQWEEIKSSNDYIVFLEKLNSGQWVSTNEYHRTISQDNHTSVAVKEQESYRFRVEARNINGDIVAKSDLSYFNTIKPIQPPEN
ncbi:hypothetical protein [Vibrio vulnificus]|uniref:hypothetical protein n=1 Tax=Vibrio vulnificus TaxID=672 RepID=UPI001CDCA9D4|nr:hypothetical protein [Vibrio vulnificus]MCA3929056.1 hypothetical protein [Vibrio vulnificus]